MPALPRACFHQSQVSRRSHPHLQPRQPRHPHRLTASSTRWLGPGRPPERPRARPERGRTWFNQPDRLPGEVASASLSMQIRQSKRRALRLLLRLKAQLRQTADWSCESSMQRSGRSSNAASREKRKLVDEPGLLPRLLPCGTGFDPYREVDQQHHGRPDAHPCALRGKQRRGCRVRASVCIRVGTS
jgi:hypothetical protein